MIYDLLLVLLLSCIVCVVRVVGSDAGLCPSIFPKHSACDGHLTSTCSRILRHWLAGTTSTVPRDNLGPLLLLLLLGEATKTYL